MSYQRAERIEKIIQQNLSKIIQSKLEDPRIGLVTITRVKVSKDLSYATIFITAGSDRASKKSLKILLSARRFIRKRLAEVLRLRKVPEISFKLDERIEDLQRVDELFEKIKK